ncbi:ABC transporter permease subunit [Methylococcus geothermalis]|uniref:ABC transporter permease subunit n=1 Tax=Methylococcus geothermalis TaxID=2681310 RepID=A0A858Q500_9GAMM|nr:ABC transporter permease subunit [Methylococcus geothermalis]QJD28894.1 ABC transporter permease subunit [Methylococcus geothermalis]
MMAFTIAARELRTLFLSPLAWSVLGVIQIILGYMFLAQLDYFLMMQPRMAGMEEMPGVTDLIVAPLFGNAGVILLLVTPLLTMRLISEERRNRTLSLLFTAPVSMTDIILGKYLGVFFFLLIMVGMLALMPLSLLMGGALDVGKLASCVLALVLLLAGFAAVGLYISALSNQPTVAAVATFGALLLLWIIDWTGGAEGDANGVLQYLSLLRHYEALLKGLVSTTDLIYFLLFILTFLVLSVHRLDNDRLQK